MDFSGFHQYHGNLKDFNKGQDKLKVLHVLAMTRSIQISALVFSLHPRLDLAACDGM